MDESMDPADELIAMFGKISTTDHDTLVTQFSRILNIDMGLARFFLEASSWSVETAVHTYLETVENKESIQRPKALPVATFLSDLSALQSTVFSPNANIEMEWTFRNDGNEPWPEDTRIAFMDGDRMNGAQSINLKAAMPGEVIRVYQRLLAPNRPGSYMGTWRLVCSAGYFGDRVWIIVSVGANEQSSQFQQQMQEQGDDMMDL